MTEFIKQTIPVTINRVELEVSAISRKGSQPPIVFLHGFGSTKEDYADIVRHASLSDYPFLAYDAQAVARPHAHSLKRSQFRFWWKRPRRCSDSLTLTNSIWSAIRWVG